MASISRDRRYADRWRARVRLPDGTQRERVFDRQVDAKRWAAQTEAAAARGEYVEPSKLRFEAYATQWLAGQHHLRSSTRGLLESRLRKHVFPVLGSLELRAVTRTHCAKVVANCVAAGLAPGTIREIARAMTSVLRAAVAERLISTNPAERLSLPKVPPKRVDVLTGHQIDEIISATEPRYRAMAILAAETGARSSELRAARVSSFAPPVHMRGDLVPARSTWTIDAAVVQGGRELGPTKTGTARDVTITRRVIAALRDHVDAFGVGPDGLMFTTATGLALDGKDATRIWGRATSGTSLPPRAGWHLLRHSHASRLLSEGVGVPAVAHRLGHASVATTLAYYAHTVPSDDDRIVQLLERGLA